ETLNISKGSLKLEQVKILNFIEKEIRTLYINTNCRIEVKGKDLTTMIDKYQMKVLFKHLIDNALKYGFINRPSKENNIIRIELNKDVQRSFYEVVVMNNGEPLQKGFHKLLQESRGLTSNRENGSGFGLYHV